MWDNKYNSVGSERSSIQSLLKNTLKTDKNPRSTMLWSLLLVYITEVSSMKPSMDTSNEQDEGRDFLTEIENWTTCEEFLDKTEFELNSVVGIKWKQFYYWNPVNEYSYVMEFEIAEQTLKTRFKMELDSKLNDPPVNWTAPGLFMQTDIDVNILFILLKNTGLFRAIPTKFIEVKRVPHFAEMLFAMKMVEPGYLGIMNCKHKHAMACAPDNSMPSNETAEAEARRFNFNSTVGYIPLPLPSSKLDPKINATRALEDLEDKNDETVDLNLNIF